mgnify:CR=1 FL=1|jgi:peptide/nickel transport system ATP-binding protein
MSFLKISNLRIDFFSNGREIPILKDINFELEENSILGITGESGSGKSMTALSILNLHDPTDGLKISGSINFNGSELLSLSEKEYATIRGNKISIIFQNPDAALNPVIKCGKQIEEILKIHQPKASKATLNLKCIDLLQSVGFDDFEHILNAYPFELSGGQQQRIVIAIAIANQPDIIIADEPTSNLDASTSSEIIDLLLDIKKRNKCSLIFISHDVRLLSKISNQIVLIKDGLIVDDISNQNGIAAPFQDYVESYFKMTLPVKTQITKIESIEPFIVLKQICKSYNSGWWFSKKNTSVILREISFSVNKGAVLGVIGKTGSGKSTLAKILAGVIDATNGSVLVNDTPVNVDVFKQNKALRRSVQLVQQDSYHAFNPLYSVSEILSEVIDLYRLAPAEEDKKELIKKTLVEFGLPEDTLKKLPSQLSGGQRQRLAIARALLLSPSVIIFDESLSALDMGNQIKILTLIEELRNKYQFTTIFISHDPMLINYISDEVIVLDSGRIIEQGSATEIFENPKHSITKQLITTYA